jgi:transcriptional regulator with XRE-family HTH domain
MWYIRHIMDVETPYLVRRARLLSGMTQSEFGDLFNVDAGTVSRWERGKLRPAPKVWKRIRDITLQASSSLNEDLVRASPVYKFLVDPQELTRPLVASKGISEGLRTIGASEEEDKPFDIAELARKTPYYDISGTRALEINQNDVEWRRGDIAYVEVHCVSPALGGAWVDAMVAPLPDRSAVLIEFAPSKRGADDGFRVKPIRLQEIPIKRAAAF